MTEWAYAPLSDYLPRRPSLLTWSVLRDCTAAAIREGYAAAGYTWPQGVTLLRQHGGEPQLNIAAWQDAARAIQPGQQGARGGLFSRLLRRPATAATPLADEAAERFAQIARWQQRVHGVGDKWMQADILQVMEEVERLARALWSLSWRIEIAAGASEPLDVTAGGASGNPPPDAIAHRSADDLEIAAPRWREAPPAATPPLKGWPLPADTATPLPAAQALALLRRRAYDARVRLVDATRVWVLACGGDAMKDRRLTRREEIFLFEIEEVKQLMTGEWNKPEQVQALVRERQNAAASIFRAS